MVGTLGAVSKILDTWLDKLGITVKYRFAAENSFVRNSKEEGVGKLKEEN